MQKKKTVSYNLTFPLELAFKIFSLSKKKSYNRHYHLSGLYTVLFSDVKGIHIDLKLISTFLDFENWQAVFVKHSFVFLSPPLISRMEYEENLIYGNKTEFYFITKMITLLSMALNIDNTRFQLDKVPRKDEVWSLCVMEYTSSNKGTLFKDHGLNVLYSNINSNLVYQRYGK